MEEKKIIAIEDLAKKGIFDRRDLKYFSPEEIDILKKNVDSKTKKEIEEFQEIDIDEIDIAFKNLKEAYENDNFDETTLAFKEFEFWLALRQIPIKISKLYMFMGKNIEEKNHLAFKNIRFRKYIFINERKLDQEYQSYSDFFNEIKEK